MSCKAAVGYWVPVREHETWGRTKWLPSDFDSTSEWSPYPGGPGGSGRGGGPGGNGGGDDGEMFDGNERGTALVGAAITAVGAHPCFQRAVKDALVCAGTFMAADILVQLISGTSPSDMDLARVMRLAVFGLLIKGPAMSWFYNAIEAQFPGKTARRVIEKVVVDQTGWAWLNNLSFLFMIPVMEGHSVNEAFCLARQQFPTLQRNAYVLWPLAHLVNFGLVPPGARTIYISAVSLMWTMVCCMTRERSD